MSAGAPPGNLFSVHSSTADVEALLGRVERKLNRWKSGGSLGALHLDVPAFGRSDADWRQEIRDLDRSATLDRHEVFLATRPTSQGLLGMLRRIVHRLTWRIFEPTFRRIIPFQRRASVGLHALHVQGEVQSEEIGEIVRDVAELREAVARLVQRLENLEKGAPR